MVEDRTSRQAPWSARATVIAVMVALIATACAGSDAKSGEGDASPARSATAPKVSESPVVVGYVDLGPAVVGATVRLVGARLTRPAELSPGASAGCVAEAVEVDDRYLAPGGADQVAPAEGRERASDCLARRRDPSGQVLLGERHGDPDPTVARLAQGLGQLDEPQRDPPGRVAGPELHAQAIGVADPGDDDPEHGERDTGRAVKQLPEALGRDDLSLDGVDGGAARGTGFTVDGAEVTEDVAGPAHGEHDRVALFAARRDLHVARVDHDHLGADVTLDEQRAARVETASSTLGLERGARGRVELVQEPCRHRAHRNPMCQMTSSERPTG